MKLHFRIVPLVVLVVLPLLNVRYLYAASLDADSLARQIETLSDRVRTLEAHVRQLEPRCAAMPAPTANAAPTPAVRDAWREIREGLTQAEVTKVLGAPQQQFTLNGNLLWYYYYASVGAGSVLFGEDGRVIGSQEPPRH